MNLTACKVLVVDDVRFTRLILTRIVHELGVAAVYEADDGDTALALLQHEGADIDCIITDLDMPRLDGIGLLKAVREGVGATPRDVKVVLLTGYSELDRIGPAMRLDVDAFVAKPLSRQALEHCFARVFATAAEAVPADGVAEPTSTSAAPVAGERLVAIADIPPDVALARDLLFGNGRLLLAAGSPITPRIKSLLGDLLRISGLPSEAWVRAAG